MSRTEAITTELLKPINPEHVAEKPGYGGGGMRLSYIEGYHAIETANRIFGFFGWQYAISSSEHKESGNNIVAVATVRLQVRNPDTGEWIVREDTGTGENRNVDTSVKEAVTDALKRALRTFGDQFGLSLYDKDQAWRHAYADSLAQDSGLLPRDEAVALWQEYRDEIADLDAAKAAWADALQKVGAESGANIPKDKVNDIRFFLSSLDKDGKKSKPSIAKKIKRNIERRDEAVDAGSLLEQPFAE